MKELAKFVIIYLPIIVILWLASMPIWLMIIAIFLFCFITIIYFCIKSDQKKKINEEKYGRYFKGNNADESKKD